MLGKILIQQERENLTISKQQAKLFKKIGIEKSSSKKGESKYELESLLNESSSGDEQHSSDDEEEEDDETAVDSDLIINFDDPDDLESGNQIDQKQQLIDFIDKSADKQKLEAFEIHMN